MQFLVMSLFLTLGVALFALLRTSVDQRPLSAWTMIDTLEEADISSSATASSILPLADVSLNQDWYLSGNRAGMKKRATIQNEQRNVVFAPSQTAIRSCVVLPENAVLQFGYAIAPAAWTMPGDGCLFEVLVEEGDRARTLFSRYINPKANKDDRRWFDATLDLSRYSLRKVTLCFITRGTYRIPKPFKRKPDERFDFALWSNPTIFPRDEWLKRTNLLVVSIDTLRADHVGCLGYSRPTTPNLDSLARESVVFENCISQSPWTLPSHASLFTGLVPSQHGVQNLNQKLTESAVTLAELMRKQRYCTMGVGSFDYLFPKYGLTQGFDEFYFHYPQRAHQVSRRALTFLKRHRGNPFFLFLHYFDPHDPYDAPAKYKRIFLPHSEPLAISDACKSPMTTFASGSARPTAQQLATTIMLYDAEIRFVDEQLGFVFDRLKKLGVWDNTMIVITSDHGEEFEEHGSFGHGLRLYDELIRVPLIIKFPHQEFAGMRVEAQVRLIDVLPTIADCIGLPLGTRPAGTSLLPLLTGNTDSVPRFAICETVARGTHRFCLRSRTLKYISPSLYEFKGTEFSFPERLFDLLDDPEESENLAPIEPELVSQLRRAAQERIAKLQSLGWLVVFSTDGAPRRFSGYLKTSGNFADVYSLTCPDERVKTQAKTIEFDKRVPFYESSLAFRLEPTDATVVADFYIDGEKASPQQVLIGCRLANPPTNPFHLTAKDAMIDYTTIHRFFAESKRMTAITILAFPERSYHTHKSAEPIHVDPRMKEALRALGYMR